VKFAPLIAAGAIIGCNLTGIDVHPLSEAGEDARADADSGLPDSDFEGGEPLISTTEARLQNGVLSADLPPLSTVSGVSPDIDLDEDGLERF
jgi:hypothetical protein